MNVTMKISRSELSKFKKWTRALDLEEGKKVKRALGAAGLEFQTVANKNTPVGTEESTGIKGYKGGTLRAGNQQHLFDGGFGLKMFNEVEYAGYVNDGTSRMRARPFFTKGFEAAVVKFKFWMNK